MQISNLNTGGGSQTLGTNKKPLVKDAANDLTLSTATESKSVNTSAVASKETPKTPAQTAADLKTYNDLLIYNANVQRNDTATEYKKQTGESYAAANGTEKTDETYNYVNNNDGGKSPVAQVYMLVTGAHYSDTSTNHSTVIDKAYGQLAITGNDVPIANTLIAFLSNNNPDATLQIGNTTPEELAKNFFQAADNIKMATAPGIKVDGNKVLATNSNNKTQTKLVEDSVLENIKPDGVLSSDELYATQIAYVLDAEAHSAAAKLNKIGGDADKRTTAAGTVNLDNDDPYNSFFEQVAKMPGKPGITEEKLAAAIKLLSDSSKTGKGLSFTKDKLNTFLYAPENLPGGPKTPVKAQVPTLAVNAAKANAAATAATADVVTKTAASTKADAAAKAAEADSKAAAVKAAAATKAATAAAAAAALDKGPAIKVYLPGASTYVIKYQAVEKAAAAAKDAAAATAAATTAAKVVTLTATTAKAAKDAVAKATTTATAAVATAKKEADAAKAAVNATATPATKPAVTTKPTPTPTPIKEPSNNKTNNGSSTGSAGSGGGGNSGESGSSGGSLGSNTSAGISSRDSLEFGASSGGHSPALATAMLLSTGRLSTGVHRF